MKTLAPLALLTALATPAQAGDITSAYSQLDLAKCKQIAKPDGQVFEGAWQCRGVAGYSAVLSAFDSREAVAFAKKVDGNNCAGLKTFAGFNAAGKTIEWRLKNGVPFAAILRWSVSIDPEDSSKQATWLVVSKVTPGESCHMHYVAGSLPGANEAARKAADTLAQGFDCETSKATFEPAEKPPGINLEPCRDQARE